MSLRFTRRTIPKSASFTVRYPADAPGTVFTNKGATGAVVGTLPSPGAQYLGVEYFFLGVVDQDISFAGAAAGDILTKNDLAANSVAASTSGEKIGALIRAVGVESASGVYKWAVVGQSVGHTFTVAT